MVVIACLLFEEAESLFCLSLTLFRYFQTIKIFQDLDRIGKFISKVLFMKRPKSAELLSLGMERFSPDEFRYHRQLMHNRPTSVRDEDDRSENSFLTDIINRGPSHLKGTSLFQVGLSRSTYRSEKRLKACK